MKKFKCIVTRIDEYEIEIDENVINDEFMQDFRETFYDLNTLGDHAGHIAQHRARFQADFIEGYGMIKVNNSIPYGCNKRHSCEDAININTISEDEYYEVEVEEIV